MNETTALQTRGYPLYSGQSYREEGQSHMLGALRFVWNATTGHRLRPWRSEYLKWRIETYSGMKAEELRARDVLGFVWREKGNLLRFLRWADRMDTWKQTGGNRLPGSDA
jgi:hypothetical protein